MSCCNCPVQPCPSRYAPWLVRIGFGVALAAFGVNHYRYLTEFVGMTKGVFPTVPAVGMVFGYLAYVFPLVEIVGGVLFAVGQLKCIAKICVLASFGGILGWAGLALALGDMSIGQTVGPAMQMACIMLITYTVIKKMSCCGMGCGAGAAACGCGKGGACACPKK
ncbi:MAG TPA: hypothetical protein PKV72_01215 [Candidatus Peribacteria bacterium]|nr:hypothetical protein [Candidatus Peribacteria bacterium]